ncbi:hypothetical protein J2Z40_003640 [Cytobacillus eiseniae]|uniref:Glycosyl transferase family 2 n=1 Tax=Cytobacillus eiseniae TaxID=762947 RepID=A0ABS4RJG8_9BACI|nr:hypothetical protein [Cytobacillus eiseniae]MBP2243052.1 hypothetical protein [Cytobacillus eiseniae]
MSKIALLTITHDPKGKNINLLKKLHKEFEKIYGELFITISDETSYELVKEFENTNFKIKIIPKKGAAEARRAVVSFGLTGTSKYYHYCDFDRLLTWGNNHLDELKNIMNLVPNYDYLILGRTERAFHTHPKAWVETEKITNTICSLELNKEVDITAGSCAFSEECAKYINKYSKDKMTDSEWSMIIYRIAKLGVDFLAVEGLEYQEVINGVGKVVSEAEEWFIRLKLSNIISESALKTGK